jgi:serine/threonine protein kinase
MLSFFIKFKSYVAINPCALFAVEFMSGGNLYDYLHKQKNVLELPKLLNFALDVCRGMGYLHQNSIIHRDLKTANLLMDKEHVCIYYLSFGDLSFLLFTLVERY